MIFSTNNYKNRYHYSITVCTKCNYLIIDFRVRLEKEYCLKLSRVHKFIHAQNSNKCQFLDKRLKSHIAHNGLGLLGSGLGPGFAAPDK